jgi:hypothetical protein
MNLKEELEKYRQFMNNQDEVNCKKQANVISENFTSDDDRILIDEFLSSELSTLTARADKLIRKTELNLLSLETSRTV